ncbi:MAG TPA: P-II family nitrogen regulator [Phycisphaeraceae bacterium]|nr:P-II family nitrogen regulator [Phycisphaeraceae bacterium]
MKEIKVFIRPNMLDPVLHALHEHPNFPGVTVTTVRGFGKVTGRSSKNSPGYGTVEVAKLECIVDDAMTEEVCRVIRTHASTGRPGDGKIIVSDLISVIRVRTGEHITSVDN